MNRFGFSFALAVVAMGSLAGASGCELQKCKNDEGESAVCLKSLKRYEGNQVQPAPLAYTPGMDLEVNGIYGDIHVVEGDTGFVGLTLDPFNYRAHDAEDQARDELENNLDYGFEVSGNAVSITTDRHDSTNGLGADINVYLPPEFDGTLTLRNDSDGPVNPGDIHVFTVGSAWRVDLSTDSLGNCDVEAGGSVVSTRARCDGEIDISGVADNLDVASTGLEGPVTVELASVEGTGAGGVVSSEDGDVEVSFPSGADFSVQAQSTADASIESELVEPECVAAGSTETAKSFTCGQGGPNYIVTAGKDGVGPSTVSLSYAP